MIIKVYEKPNNVSLYMPSELVSVINREIIRPSWIDKYDINKKLKLLEERRRIDEEISELYKFEELLFSQGKRLVDAVAYALTWLGFKVNKREGEGVHDLEVIYNDFLT